MSSKNSFNIPAVSHMSTLIATEYRHVETSTTFRRIGENVELTQKRTEASTAEAVVQVVHVDEAKGMRANFPPSACSSQSACGKPTLDEKNICLLNTERQEFYKNVIRLAGAVTFFAFMTSPVFPFATISGLLSGAFAYPALLAISAILVSLEKYGVFGENVNVIEIIQVALFAYCSFSGIYGAKVLWSQSASMFSWASSALSNAVWPILASLDFSRNVGFCKSVWEKANTDLPVSKMWDAYFHWNTAMEKGLKPIVASLKKGDLSRDLSNSRLIERSFLILRAEKFNKELDNLRAKIQKLEAQVDRHKQEGVVDNVLKHDLESAKKELRIRELMSKKYTYWFANLMLPVLSLFGQEEEDGVFNNYIPYRISTITGVYSTLSIMSMVKGNWGGEDCSTIKKAWLVFKRAVPLIALVSFCCIASKCRDFKSIRNHLFFVAMACMSIGHGIKGYLNHHYLKTRKAREELTGKHTRSFQDPRMGMFQSLCMSVGSAIKCGSSMARYYWEARSPQWLKYVSTALSLLSTASYFTRTLAKGVHTEYEDKVDGKPARKFSFTRTLELKDRILDGNPLNTVGAAIAGARNS